MGGDVFWKPYFFYNIGLKFTRNTELQILMNFISAIYYSGLREKKLICFERSHLHILKSEIASLQKYHVRRTITYNNNLKKDAKARTRLLHKPDTWFMEAVYYSTT